MKVILSRKGLDSSFGGIPSLILPDGKILSIPIPGDEDEIPYSSVNSDYDRRNLYEILSEVSSTVLYNNVRSHWTSQTMCHLDPDISKNMFPRESSWRGCFGQADAAQTVLERAGVGPGDIFLFFGWFKHTEIKNGRLCFCKGQGFHMIYGYLQIEEVFYTAKSETVIPQWLQYHPHALPRRINRHSNCIYISTMTSRWDKNISGCGNFPIFDKDIMLTKPGMTRSKWSLPDEFHGVKLTYHNTNKSWKDGYFQSACRGQEFVFEENKIVEDWAKRLVNSHAIKTCIY